VAIIEIHDNWKTALTHREQTHGNCRGCQTLSAHSKIQQIATY